MYFPIKNSITLIVIPLFLQAVPRDSVEVNDRANGFKTGEATIDYSMLNFPGDAGNSYLFNIFKKYPYVKDSRYLYEADIVTSYMLFGNIYKNKQKPYSLVITPKIKFRMLNLHSTPILSPSYIFHVKYYNYIKDRRNNKISRTWLISANHHSNGNSENIIEKGQLNLLEGNFSTNYFLLEHYWLFYGKTNGFRLTQLAGLGYEYHLPDSLGRIEIPGAMIDRLSENFGRDRIHLDYSLESMIHSPSQFWNNSKFKMSFSYTYVLEKAKGNYLRQFKNPSRIPNYIFAAEANYKPGWRSGLGFFVRYRGGQDDYNIYFFKNLWQMQFGLYMESFVFYANKSGKTEK